MHTKFDSDSFALIGKFVAKNMKNCVLQKIITKMLVTIERIIII